MPGDIHGELPVHVEAVVGEKDTTSAPASRTSCTTSAIRSSRLRPKLSSGNIQPGLAMGM
jgi:hypothetical protein